MLMTVWRFSDCPSRVLPRGRQWTGLWVNGGSRWPEIKIIQPGGRSAARHNGGFIGPGPEFGLCPGRRRADGMDGLLMNLATRRQGVMFVGPSCSCRDDKEQKTGQHQKLELLSCHRGPAGWIRWTPACLRCWLQWWRWSTQFLLPH